VKSVKMKIQKFPSGHGGGAPGRGLRAKSL